MFRRLKSPDHLVLALRAVTEVAAAAEAKVQVITEGQALYRRTDQRPGVYSSPTLGFLQPSPRIARARAFRDR